MTLHESHVAWATLRADPVSTVHVVVPAGLDDPGRPSGGNAYDRRICRGLTAAGWQVVEHAVSGSLAVAGHRGRSRRWRAWSPPSPTAPSCWSTA